MDIHFSRITQLAGPSLRVENLGAQKAGARTLFSFPSRPTQRRNTQHQTLSPTMSSPHSQLSLLEDPDKLKKSCICKIGNRRCRGKRVHAGDDETYQDLLDQMTTYRSGLDKTTLDATALKFAEYSVCAAHLRENKHYEVQAALLAEKEVMGVVTPSRTPRGTSALSGVALRAPSAASKELQTGLVLPSIERDESGDINNAIEDEGAPAFDSNDASRTFTPSASCELRRYPTYAFLLIIERRYFVPVPRKHTTHSLGLFLTQQLPKLIAYKPFRAPTNRRASKTAVPNQQPAQLDLPRHALLKQHDLVTDTDNDTERALVSYPVRHRLHEESPREPSQRRPTTKAERDANTAPPRLDRRA